MKYYGIELDPPKGPVALSHSTALDMIKQESSTHNMDWSQVFLGLPWGDLKEAFPKAFESASRISSLINMDYQVCNGGIGQYFDNRYHEPNDPYSEHDVKHYSIDEQKDDFYKIVDFARQIFPERIDDNYALQRAAASFRTLEYEENAAVCETIYCDEDEYVLDDETGEEIKNPDYWEPYDETLYENVIHGDDNFEDIFYAANKYLEECLELYAQFCCKDLAITAERMEKLLPEQVKLLRATLPSSAFPSPTHRPLDEQLKSAQARASGQLTGPDGPAKSPEL